MCVPSICFYFSEILECESSPCLNGGKCIEGSFGSGVGSGLDTSESAYTCECKPGFTGKNCETSKCFLGLGQLFHGQEPWNDCSKRVISKSGLKTNCYTGLCISACLLILVLLLLVHKP